MTNSTIPKLIHHIWIQGESQIPEQERRNIENIQRLNPGWQLKIWDDDSIRDLILQRQPFLLDVYDNVNAIDESKFKIHPYATKSDIARWVIVYEFGGCYMDADALCSDGLDAILKVIPDKEPMLAANQILWVIWSSGMFLATAKHPLLLKTLQSIPTSKDRGELGAAMSNVLNGAEEDERKMFIAIDSDYISMYHCGSPSVCMLPQKPSASAGAWHRNLGVFWCRWKGLITLLLILLIVMLVVMYWRTISHAGRWLYRIAFNTCVERNSRVICELD